MIPRYRVRAVDGSWALCTEDQAYRWAREGRHEVEVEDLATGAWRRLKV